MNVEGPYLLKTIAILFTSLKLTAIQYGTLASMHVEARGILLHWPNTQQKKSAFSCNNRSKRFDDLILADRFVLNFKKVKKLKVPFFPVDILLLVIRYKTFTRH